MRLNALFRLAGDFNHRLGQMGWQVKMRKCDVISGQVLSEAKRSQNLVPLLVLMMLGVVLSILSTVSPLLSLGLVLAAGIGFYLASVGVQHTLLLIALLVPFRFEYELLGLSARVMPIDLLIGCALIATLLKVLLTRRISLLRVPHLSAFVTFLAWSTVSRVIGPEMHSPVQGVWYIYKNTIEFPLLYILLFANLRNTSQIERLLKALILSSTLSAMIGIVQTVTGGEYLTGRGLHGNLRYLGFLMPYSSDLRAMYAPYLGRLSGIMFIQGTRVFRAHGGLANHIDLGAFLSTALPLTITLFLKARSRRARILTSGMAAVQALALLFTFSRAAWVAIAAAVLLILVLTRSKRILTIMFVSLLILGIVVIVAAKLNLTAQLGERFSSIFDPTSAPAMQARFRVWNKSLEDIARNPFVGRGTDRVGEEMFWGIVASSHNVFLNVAYAEGIIALMALLVLVAYLYREGWQLYKRGDDRFLRAVGLGGLASLTGFITAGIFSSLLSYPGPEGLFWMMAGILASASRLAPPPSAESGQLSSGTQPSAGA